MRQGCCPSFPGTFASLEVARAFCAAFFNAYNHHHRHSTPGYLSPADYEREQLAGRPTETAA